MSSPPRIFLDVTHTRTQRGMVGITRTVRNLAVALSRQGLCHPVAFGAGRFGRSDVGPPRAGESAALWTALGSPAMRSIAAALPPALLQQAWSAAARLAFSRPAGPPAGFRAGDWLVLADQSWNYPVWRAAAKARRQGARVALVVYDLIPLLQPHYCEPLFSSVFAKWLPRTLAESDAVVCISGSTAEDLARWAAAQGCALPPVTHFRLGSDATVAAGGTVRAAVRDFLGGPDPVFAMVGSIEPRKAHAEVLDLFDRLWSDGLRCRLFVAGRAHARSRVTAARMTTHPRSGCELLFLQDASDAELALAYQTCRALLFPSRAEGFGLPLVEARTQGCPVVARALPCIRELADAGTSLFEDDERFESLVRDAAAAPSRMDVPPMAAFGWPQSAGQLRERLTEMSA